jgi:hypothetical protein
MADMRTRWTVMYLMLLPALGCGPGSPSLVVVTGRITYRGVPVRTGCVVFTPDPQRGGSGPHARADIQPDGSYQLRTGEAAGAAPGWHRITVAAVEMNAPRPGDAYGVPRPLLPGKYADPEMSGLSREVAAGRENRIDLDLE